MIRKESPREYSARRVRVRLERAKVAVMEAQQELARDDFRLNPNSLQEMTDAALKRLDAAWAEVLTIEMAEKEIADA